MDAVGGFVLAWSFWGVLGLSMVLPVGVTAGLWTMGLEHYFGTRSRGESLGLRYQLGF